MAVRKFSYLLAAALLLAAAQLGAAQDFFLKKGDVVVVMGDSITEQRLYSNYLEIWSQTRFPSYNLVFRNVGIGGDTSGGGNGRFKRDVLPFKPTVLTVDFGMNDGGYIWAGKIVNKKEMTDKDVDARLANYLKGQQGIADQAKAAGIRVAWITPQPVENNPGAENDKYNSTLEKFSEGVKQIAEKNGGRFADQFHPYWAVVQKAREAGEKGRITGGDAVHPGPAGQALMAASILKALGFPRAVSSVAVDVAGKSIDNNSNQCKVADVSIQEAKVSFKRTDFALPFFPDQAKSILKWTPLLEDMNHYGLKVKGLKAGKYDIKLDGKTVAVYNDAALAKGVNLASAVLAAGPIADQVKEVAKAVTDKTNYFHDQIFSLMRTNKVANNPDFAQRMAKMPELDAAIRKALEPRAHLVEIVPVQ